ncbi:DivIVA domain-containing protein [Saxibacter everestensis]|uniref:Cell wall synthesis protein Wag31 n=1 Tax=Saxibacter everestensis TaxID=2909229 RepID=A0ABY8QWF7_9MICO|nr:DivIVA domain-containing protein [Brevibacteriaceae bacterium ZFBP1038]
MALTPEDVVNKRFQPTKFREGYDQDEVDDFLDEVVAELRRVYQENDELRQKLSAAELRVSELSRGESAAAPASDKAAQAPATAEKTEAAAGDSTATKAVPVAPAAEPKQEVKESVPAESAPAEAPPAVEKPAPVAPVANGAAAPAASAGPDDAHGLISLAQRLHDEHVQKGEQKRDELIAEAEDRATGLIGEAEEKRRATLSSLEEEQAQLERKIDELRNFERQYRTRLKSYLQDQLRDLDSRGSLVPATLRDGDDSAI